MNWSYKYLPQTPVGNTTMNVNMLSCTTSDISAIICAFNNQAREYETATIQACDGLGWSAFQYFD